MITRSDDYVAYCRESARQAREPHDLALRGRHKRAVTQAIYQRIAADVQLCAEDDLVEIGCGDGTLLLLAEQVGCRSATGFLATDEEVTLLARHGIQARQGLSDNLPLPDAVASVVVCNNVLLIVPRDRIAPSLREMVRISKPGARIYIGEIPFVETADPLPQFSTRRELLSLLYRQNGFRTWAGMVRRMAWWQITGRPAIVNAGTAVSFWAPPEEFIAMATRAGLEYVRHWRHEDPDTRNNYLFRKAS